MRKRPLFPYLTLLFSALQLAVITHNAFAIDKKLGDTMPQKIVIRDKIPEGVQIENDKVTLKEGYFFEKVSKNRVNVMARRNNGVTGSFDCTCNGSDGGCDIVTTPSSVSCVTGSCKSSCYMITTIPGGPAPTPGNLRR